MTFIRKLRNPVALVAEGFLAGALLFGALHPSVLGRDAAKANAQSDAIVQSLIG